MTDEEKHEYMLEQLRGIAKDPTGFRNAIFLTPAEIQSGFDRVQWAEGLIKQLPEDHEGRNSWLLNYGTKQ